MRRALLYLGLLTILTGTFLLHNHSITAFQPTSRGIGLIVIGAALGISSTLLQGFYKNLNADPGFMGITTGSVLGAILGIHLGFQFGSRIGILIAVGFALISFYIFDWASKSFLTNGILITLIFSTFILLLTERTKLDGTYWTLGSFKELDKHNVKLFAPFVEVGIITSFFIARHISKISARNKLAVGIGVAFLIGPFVATTGALIGFGLFVPNLTRRLIKGDTRRVLSYAALVGPIVLLLMDIAVNHLNEISVSALAIPLGFLLSRFGKEQAQS